MLNLGDAENETGWDQPLCSAECFIQLMQVIMIDIAIHCKYLTPYFLQIQHLFTVEAGLMLYGQLG